MAGDGASFQIDIPVSAPGVEPAASAVARLSAELTASQSAAQAAAAAVQASDLAYRQAQASADAAAKALERMGVAVDSQKAKAEAAAAKYGLFSSQYQAASDKLGVLTEKQAQLAARSEASNSAVRQAAGALDEMKAKSAEAASQVEELSGSLKEATDAEKKAGGSGKINEMAEGLGKLGGPVGALGQKALGAVEGVKKLTASMGDAGIYAAVAVGAAAIAAALVAIAAAGVGAVAAVAGWAVSLADASRTQELLYAGMAKSTKGGKELSAAINSVGNTVPLAQSEIEGLAKPLVEAGLKGKELEGALQDAANAAAEAKFGPEFAKQLNSLPNLAARLKKNMSNIFGGLGIDKFLDALGSVVALFNEGTASANAIKVLFESIFQPLIDGATGFIPKMVGMFIQFEILVLKAAIQIKLWGKEIDAIASVFGTVAVVIGVVLGAALAVVVGVMALVTATTYAFWTALSMLGQLMLSIGTSVVSAFTGAFDAVVGFLTSINLGEIGSNILMGLVNGILGAGPALLGAITGAVSGAIGAAKSLLGIASPSKVFKEIGNFTGEGMAIGVEDSSAGVQDSLETMVTPPELPAPAAAPGSAAATPGAPGAAASAGAGGVYTITINASGGDGASIADALRALLADLGVQAGMAAS